jgi:hypothetical protein
MRPHRILCLTVLYATLAASTLATDGGTPTVSEVIVPLPRFEVRESGMRVTDFGMSVVTNFGVLFGGKIQWMRVGTVVPGSSAALRGLAMDDQIALIGDTKVSDFSRSLMLHTFFHRKLGDRIRLLVRDGRTGRWRFVELSANEKRIEP